MKPSDSQKPRSIAGFSLVETTLAVGILGSGVLLLMAILPSALDNMRYASGQSMEQRIAQNIISELMLNEWDRLDGFDTDQSGVENRYFDSQGIELRPTQLGEAHVFTARVEIEDRDLALPDPDFTLKGAYGTTVTTPYSLGSEGGVLPATVSQNLRRVIVKVTNTPDPNFAFDPVADANRYRSYGTVISNMMDNDTPISRASSNP